MATKKAVKKTPAKKAPKAPVEKFIVVRDSCENLCSEQLQVLKDAETDARDMALENCDAYTVYKVVGVRRYNVPSAVVVEDL